MQTPVLKFLTYIITSIPARNGASYLISLSLRKTSLKYCEKVRCAITIDNVFIEVKFTHKKNG
jgi:hypothetical protein